jgi:hypothetical protein
VLDGVRIIPGPHPPTGGSAPRLTSTSWDAIQHGDCSGIGPVVINSVVRRAGDDTWSIQPSDYLVLKSTTDDDTHHGAGNTSRHAAANSSNRGSSSGGSSSSSVLSMVVAARRMYVVNPFLL